MRFGRARAPAFSSSLGASPSLCMSACQETFSQIFPELMGGAVFPR